MPTPKNTVNIFEDALAAEGATGPFADLARRIYKQESTSGKNTKTSNRGAVGGMQVLPDTFDGVKDANWNINDPLHNARGGIRYLREMYAMAGQDPRLAAVGYYSGPRGMEKARRGVAVRDPENPNAPNSLQYGNTVAGNLPQGNKVPPQAAVPAAVTAVPVVAPTTPVVAPPVTTAGEPAAVVAAAQPVAQPDAWQTYLDHYQRTLAEIKAKDLAYGQNAAAVAAPPDMPVPDFMASLGGMGQQVAPAPISFSPFTNPLRPTGRGVISDASNLGDFSTMSYNRSRQT